MNIMIVEDDHILAKDLLSLPRRRGIKRRSAADNGAGSRLCGTADIALVDLACRRTDRSASGAQAHRQVPTGGHLCNRGRKV